MGWSPNRDYFIMCQVCSGQDMMVGDGLPKKDFTCSGRMNKSVAGFRPPLQRVGCRALGLWRYTETNTLIGWEWKIYCTEPGYSPLENSQLCSKRGSSK